MPPLPLLVLAALLQATPGRPYREERQLLDRHLAQLARALPDAPSPGEDAALLLQLATEGGLRNVEIGPPTITETGPLGQSRRTLTATATFPDVDRFFRGLQGAPRLIDVESLILRPADFGVRMEARLRLHHRAARAASTVSLDPTRTRDRTRGATKEEAARFARDEQLALEKTVAIDDLRRSQTSPRMFLAETGSVFRDAAAALTFGSLDGDTGRFSLRGVVAGMGAADGLERRLEGGFFRIREFSRAQKEACFQFEVVGESFRAGPEAALPLPVDEPFRPTEPFCRQDRDAPAMGPAVTLRASGSDQGGLSLRAVDADLADIAAMIESLSREPFVVAGDLRGRVSVEFAGASIDDALKALPVRTDLVGGVRLMRSPTGPSTAPAEAEEDSPSGRFSFRAKRAHGEDVLAALAEAEPAFVARGPSGLAKLSVFAREASIGDVRRAVLAGLGVIESREDGARVLRLESGSPGPGVPIAATNGARVVFRARDLTVEELALAGIGRAGDEYVAFVYAPLGEIVPIRLGDNLADGVIAGLDAQGLLVDSAEGPVRISLATLKPR